MALRSLKRKSPRAEGQLLQQLLVTPCRCGTGLAEPSSRLGLLLRSLTAETATPVVTGLRPHRARSTLLEGSWPFESLPSLHQAQILCHHSHSLKPAHSQARVFCGLGAGGGILEMCLLVHSVTVALGLFLYFAPQFYRLSNGMVLPGAREDECSHRPC